MKNQLQLQAAWIIPQLEEGDELHYQIHRIKEASIRKTTTATEMAIKAWDPTKENMEKTIPPQYQDFTKIFSDEEAKCFPPSRSWDHQIQLKPGASDIINGKVYPLTLEETKVQDKYIDEGLEKGYLRPGEGLYGSSSFFVAKKNGQLHPIVNYRILNQHTVVVITPLPLIPQIYDDL